MKINKVNNQFVLKTWNGNVYSGNQAETIARMLLLGVQEEEVAMGFTYLIQDGYKEAEYGIGLSGNGPQFIYAQ